MQNYLLASVFIAVLSLTGCSSAPDRHERSPERAAPPLPAMTGEETFAGGQLLVEASVSRGYRGFGRRGDGSGGGGKGRRHGGGGQWGGGGGGGYQRPEGGDDEGPREPVQPRLHESTMPPIVIQLRATNKGTEPLEVTWVECNSALGNFAVLPEKMTLPAGESAETERMTSLLGPSGDEIPVTVTLRAHGKAEKKTLVLRPAPAEPKS